MFMSNLSRSILKMKMEKKKQRQRRGSNLRDAQPVVSQLHGFSGILHWFHWIPGLPVWTQTCERHTEQHCQQQQHTDTHSSWEDTAIMSSTVSYVHQGFLNKTYNIALIENTSSTVLKHTHTRCTAVDQCSQCLAVAPVPAEVGDWQIRDFVLDPAQQTLLRRL